MEWHYLNNQFENATDGSFRLMLTVTNDHFAKLKAQQADPDILVLLNRTTPVHESYLSTYSSWKAALGGHKGSTAATDRLLEDLRSKYARQWDTSIMVKYDKGTSEHTTLLPNGREPFQSGTMDERVQAVNTLKLALADYPPLVGLLTTVSNFHTQLKNARDGQQAKEQLVDQGSTNLELARKTIALMMYRNLGVLIDKFGAEPDNINNYFEVSLLQSHASNAPKPVVEEFIGTVGPMNTVNITSSIAPEAKIIITNTGSVMLRFCAAPDATTSCGEGLDLAPGQVHEAKGSDFDNPANPFFNVSNFDPMNEGNYNVEVVTPPKDNKG